MHTRNGCSMFFDTYTLFRVRVYQDPGPVEPYLFLGSITRNPCPNNTQKGFIVAFTDLRVNLEMVQAHVIRNPGQL